MPLEPGKTLSHYRLVEKIGEGGMGVVWKAEDTVLERQVAIKVLPEDFAQDPERLARFEREARVLASLNHPGIASIYGLDRADEVRFLVLELVPGETLAARLRRGPIPWREALQLGRQVAEAVEAAHNSGVLHRDLKPANVNVTPDDKVKVLDFGLAKPFVTDGSPDDSVSPTVTSSGTDQGVILGTAAYMSPEQARGKPLDRRTDIWSFGCMLYEMMTARSPFGGDTVQDVLARILEREPDWSQLRDDVPARVRDLLRRCLCKDPVRRLRDIGDAGLEIDDALEGVTLEGAASAVPTARRGRWHLAAVGAFFALAGVLVTWLALRGASVPAVDNLQVVQVARLTHDPGLSEWPTWSPDGNLLAFASDRTGNFDIFVRRVEGGQDVQVTDDPGQDFQPAFSPDGNWIAFISTRSSRTGMIKIGSTFGMEFRTLGGDLWLVPALGGSARRLARDANYPAWHPDGGRVGYVSGREDHRSILEVGADGGAPREILGPESSGWEIVRMQYSPSGAWISFESLDGKVFLIPAEGGTPKELVDASTHVWDASGERLYFLSRDPRGGTRLQSVAVDEAAGELRGEPRALGLMTGTLRDLAIARDGRQLAVSELEGSLNLTRLPLTRGGDAPAGPERTLSNGRVIDRYPNFSPDGKRITYTSDRLGPTEIWILDLETGAQEPLQHLPGPKLGETHAYWSPDGEKLSVTRLAEGGLSSIWLVALDGSQAEELVAPGAGLLGAAFSPDGTKLLYSAVQGEYKQLFAFDLSSRQSDQLTSSPWDTYEGIWSPDGRRLTVISNQDGSVQLWGMPAEGGTTQQLTTGDERVRHAFYSPDGRWVYFQPSHRNIYRLPADGGRVEAVTTFPESGLFVEEPTLSPDGRSLAYCRSNGGSSLWLLTVGYDRVGSGTVSAPDRGADGG